MLNLTKKFFQNFEITLASVSRMDQEKHAWLQGEHHYTSKNPQGFPTLTPTGVSELRQVWSLVSDSFSK